MKHILFIVFVFWGIAGARNNALSEPLSTLLMPTAKEYALGKTLEYCEDSRHEWTIENVANVSGRGFQGSFQPSQMQFLNLKFSRSAYWLRFTVKNMYATEEVFMLEYAYPTIDTLEFYRPSSMNTYSQLRVGDMQPYSAREIPHRNYLCRIRLRPGEEQTVYLRIASAGPLIAPITLWHTEGLLQKDYWERLLNGMFYGIMLVMLLYNLFLTVAMRERSYLFYVLYIASFLTYQACLDGTAIEYLWQNAPLWSNTAYLLFAAVTACTAALFTRDFLALSFNSRLFDRALFGIMLMSIVLGVTALFAPYGRMITPISGLVSVASLTTLAAAVFCVWRGYRPAYYFLIAWTALIVSVFLFTMIGFGLVPYTNWTWYSSRFSAVLEVVLLSLGLAYRINLLRKDQEKAAVLEAQNTELSHLNQELHKRNDDLHHANTKLDEANTFKTRMVSIVSHDLKNPLNTIRLLANSLKTELRSDSREGAETLRALVQETHHSSKMIEELLDMAALDMGKITLKPQEMDFGALVAAVVFLQSTQAEKKQQSIQMHVPTECVIRCDEARLRQVVENLLSNAIKFSPFGTVISVHLTAPTQGMVSFSVEDHGPGLTDDDKTKIFGHFQKLSARPTADEHSSGVGLAIVKQIVELHKGTIRVESEVGKGARFIVELPVGM